MTTQADPKYTNELVNETSPYLLQHAHNPVDWHPWGEAAIQKSRDENKPIFLSIGYSACHWCHVMERESFENEEIARRLNELFVCIKVDREERPDLDDIYMQATQLLTGQGGWPMSVFLTPELKPFFAGTYFPPVDGPRGVGFATIVERLHEAYEQEHEKVVESSEEILQAIGQAESAIAASGAEVGVGMLDAATRSLESSFDRAHGGFGGAPKFPAHSGLDLLLRECRRRGEPQLLDMVVRTLDHMAAGGIHDQILGGFARYSVDARWLVPHFEKMLYDNAQLASRYLDLYTYLGNKAHLRVARRVLDYVLRDMTDAAGGYYSAQDADSEGEEGKFYVWTKAEVMEILGAEEGALYCEFFDITEGGNFEGKCIPNIIRPAEEFARSRDLEPETFQTKIDALSAKLEVVRGGRIPPSKDDKVLTAWNGLMISAMARAAQVTGEAKYRDSAEKAARFILTEMKDPEGNLLRVWREGTAKVPAFAEDYANLVLGLVELYQTTFDASWLEEADGLAQGMIDRFFDDENGGFFTTDGKDPSVILRKKEYYDGVTPSGNSGATMALLRLGLMLDKSPYREAAMKTLDSMHPYLTQMPGGVHFLLCATETVLNPPVEVAIVGDPASEQTQALVQAVYGKYLPGLAIAVCAPDQIDKGANASVALLQDKKQLDGKSTVYVCKNYQCEKPVHTVDELLKLLS